MNTNQKWGLALLVAGAVSLIIAPPSAYVLIALGCIAIFGGGYVFVTYHLSDGPEPDIEKKEKDNEDV